MAKQENHVLGLLFLGPDAEHPDFCHICLEHWTKGGYKGVNPEMPLLTPQCTLPELEAHIASLEEELDRLRKMARDRFKRAAEGSGL